MCRIQRDQRMAKLDDSEAELAAYDGNSCEQEGYESACVQLSVRVRLRVAVRMGEY